VIVDTSAVIAVLLGEARERELADKLSGEDAVAIGAPTLLEAGIVMVGGMGEAGRGSVAGFLENFGVEVIPFGKGRHPARLNYGDCMAYATAAVAEEPLLFVGDDFARTDIEAA
jgi:ribonuclease VapC